MSPHPVKAVLIADMAGFSALMTELGEDAALAVKDAFHSLGRALAVRHGGTFVKGWSDDIGAVFPTSAAAARCARALNGHIACSAGIAFGPVILDRPPGDFWGCAVNRASRLGEDLAARGEILLDNAAAADLAGVPVVTLWPDQAAAAGLERLAPDVWRLDPTFLPDEVT